MIKLNKGSSTPSYAYVLLISNDYHNTNQLREAISEKFKSIQLMSAESLEGAKIISSRYAPSEIKLIVCDENMNGDFLSALKSMQEQFPDAELAVVSKKPLIKKAIADAGLSSMDIALLQSRGFVSTALECIRNNISNISKSSR